jgi:hypothetical protein
MYPPTFTFAPASLLRVVVVAFCVGTYPSTSFVFSFGRCCHVIVVQTWAVYAHRLRLPRFGAVVAGFHLRW